MKAYRPADERGTSGKIAAVHAQIGIAALMVVGQLWLLTIALNEFLLGHVMGAVTTALASALAFLASLGALLAYRE